MNNYSQPNFQPNPSTGLAQVYVHLAVPYEAKVRNQWTDLAENRAVSSYSHPKATL